MAAPAISPPKAARPLMAGVVGVIRFLEEMGRQLTFFAGAFRHIPWAMQHYRKEVSRLIAEVGLGVGAIAIAGGAMVIIGIAAAMAGAGIGLTGYYALSLIGVEPIVGFITAFANTRELVPLIAGATFAAQVGTRYTAQLGSMRISEEIDALEVMAIHSLVYLISTRIIAALVAIFPLYLAALSASYLASKAAVIFIFGQSTGTYDHYFQAMLSSRDIIYSLTKALIFAVLITLIHCYQGYTASGGPEGVGRAAGRAIRASLLTIAIADMFTSLLFYGGAQSIPLSG